MVIVTTWLRGLGGVLFACLVLSLTAVPALDALVCSAEAPAAAQAHGVAEVAPTLTAHDHGGKRDGGGAGELCVHGHCHQPAAPAQLASIVLEDADVGAVDLLPADAGMPPSRSPEGPLEPPRA